MNPEIIILVVEDDEGHAELIKKALFRSGMTYPILNFVDGLSILDFLLRRGPGPHLEDGKAYVLLLDIRIPGADGFEVLTQIKSDPELRKMPVIMLTTTKTTEDIERCHALGCSNYIIKPTEYEEFEKFVQYLGLFLSVVRVPKMSFQSVKNGSVREKKNEAGDHQ